MIRVVDRPQRILVADADERVRVAERHQRILIGPTPTGDAPEPPPPPDYFYGLAGGLARYDARTLEMADGAPVAAWGDVSGQVGAAVQDVEARQPTYVSAAPGVRFPGGGQHHLRMPAALWLAETEPWTLVLLCDRISSGSQTWIARGPHRWGLSQVTLFRAAWYAGGRSAGLPQQGAWPLGMSVMTLACDGEEIRGWRDGVELRPPVLRGVDLGDVSPVTLGARVEEDGSVAAPLQGIVHDLLFFDRALSPSELTTLRAELTTDWSL